MIPLRPIAVFFFLRLGAARSLRAVARPFEVVAGSILKQAERNHGHGRMREWENAAWQGHVEPGVCWAGHARPSTGRIQTLILPYLIDDRLHPSRTWIALLEADPPAPSAALNVVAVIL